MRIWRKMLANDQGMILVISLLILALLLGAGVGAIVSTQTDLKTSSNLKNGKQAFYLAEAGVNRALQQMANGDGTNDFSTVSASSSTTTLFSNESLGQGSYTVTAQVVSGSSPVRVKVTSTGCVPAANPCSSGNSQVVIEAQFKAYSIGPPPGTITLVGSSASFAGGNSNAKKLNGNEATGCGSTPSKPVVAVTDGASETAVQTAIDGSKPATYITSYADGPTDDIVASGAVADIKNAYGFDYTSLTDLESLMDRVRRGANEVVASGGTPTNLGSVGSEKIVFVDGDLTLGASSGSGAGILAVKGNLSMHGNVSYTGLILVIGKGFMTRFGGGNGQLKGATIVAKVVGPDGVYGTADDVIGSTPTADTSGGGNSDYLYCSTVIDRAFSRLLTQVNWKEVF